MSERIYTFHDLLQRVYQRATENMKHEYLYASDMLDSQSPTSIIFDPYEKYSPFDSKYWQELLFQVQDNQELFGRLFYMRGGGTKLIRHKKWGFALYPVIGKNGWDSQEQYDREKKCLDAFAMDLIRILKNVAKNQVPEW